LDIISVCSQSFSRVLQRKTLIASPKQIVKTQLKHVKTLLSALVMNHDELLLHPFEGYCSPVPNAPGRDGDVGTKPYSMASRNWDR